MKKQYIWRAWPVIGLAAIYSMSFLVRANGLDRRIPSSSKIEPMTINTDTLKNPTVKKAIDALQGGNANAWFALFTKDAALYDDGHKQNFRSFFESALGHEYFTGIDKVENNGLDVYGRFHSDKWGDFKTYFKFQMDGGGRIVRLDIGQASY